MDSFIIKDTQKGIITGLDPDNVSLISSSDNDNIDYRFNSYLGLKYSKINPDTVNTVFIEDTNRVFRWVQGNTEAEDGIFIVDQTSETANGRWVSESEEYVKNIYIETSYLANKFDLFNKTIDVPNLPKVYVTDVVLRNSDELVNPNGFSGKSQGDNKVNIQFENLTENPIHTQILHVAVKMLRDPSHGVNTGILSDLILVARDDGSIFYSLGNLNSFNTLTIPEWSGLFADIREITHDVEKREIYFASGDRIGKITGVYIDSGNNLQYERQVNIDLSASVENLRELISYGDYLYISEGERVGDLDVKVHRLNKSDLTIENSLTLTGIKGGADSYVNEYGFYFGTGSTSQSVNPLRIVKIELDLSSFTTIYTSTVGFRDFMVCSGVGNIIYYASRRAADDTILNVVELDTSNDTVLRDVDITVTDNGDPKTFSCLTDGNKLLIYEYDVDDFPNDGRLLVVDITNLTLDSENVENTVLANDNFFDSQNNRFLFVGLSGTNIGNIISIDNTSMTQSLFSIDAGALYGIDKLKIPKIN